MVNKPQNAEPPDDFGVTKVIQTNAAGNIAGSLTTIAQEGSFGVVDTSDRSMLYLYPSYSFAVNRLGLARFQGGRRAVSVPAQQDRAATSRRSSSTSVRPARPARADVLFERDTFRNNGPGTDGQQRSATRTSTAATSRIAGSRAATSRSRPASASTPTASTRKDREKVLGPALPPGFPTDTADKEFDQTTFAPNFGVAWNAGRWGVVPRHGRPLLRVARSRRRRRHVAPAVRGRDRRRARVSRGRVAPLLNQVLPGAFPLGVNYGFENKKTYTNEFSAGWEKQLPHASSLGVTFMLKRTWDFQGADDENVIRDPVTGAFLGRPFPDLRRGAADLRAELLRSSSSARCSSSTRRTSRSSGA